MRIAVDMDDTCSLFVKEWVNRYNDLYDDNLDYLTITEWDIEKFVLCSKEDMYNILGFKHFFRKVKPETRAREVIDKLRDKGHEVFIVTAYNPSVCIDKSWWLKEYMGFAQEDIIFCNKKHLINADLLLDDGAHNHAKFEGLKIVYDRPHNQHMQEWEYDYRVKNWTEFETLCIIEGIL